MSCGQPTTPAWTPSATCISTIPAAACTPTPRCGSTWTFCGPESTATPTPPTPSSAVATRLVESARRSVLDYFNARDDEYIVIFTQNASGALKLVGESYPFAEGRYLLTFDNHNSVNGIREFARSRGARVTYLPVELPDLRVPEKRLIAELEEGEGSGVSKGKKLFAYPAQSNFSSVQHPLSWIDAAHERGWDVLLDTAAFAPTNRLDLGVCKPDFMPLSFYKMFGYPTGIGALLVRREKIGLLRRPWFAGGTITVASVQGDRYYLSDGAAAFEDGTVDYLGIPAVEIGLRPPAGRRRRPHPRASGRPHRLAPGKHARDEALHRGAPRAHLRAHRHEGARRLGDLQFPRRPGQGRRPSSHRGGSEQGRHIAAHRLLLQSRRGGDRARHLAGRAHDLLHEPRARHASHARRFPQLHRREVLGGGAHLGGPGEQRQGYRDISFLCPRLSGQGEAAVSFDDRPSTRRAWMKPPRFPPGKVGQKSDLSSRYRLPADHSAARVEEVGVEVEGKGARREAGFLQVEAGIVD